MAEADAIFVHIGRIQARLLHRTSTASSRAFTLQRQSDTPATADHN